ncbi:1-acyl-sn-glycerol-3-phosphate acyltransferase alpha [Contarinia nasturtii]|uniref:1-acyl-sn-glycerol-3-phosphate acyltransferase alpha n=1 Tax=Contarinia nasturtii TaxID=265458 RepID=UPI0012D3E349|nr:1-acyl-sn-glycerol-3-phosphate acyltransferase alpha [Contarinia nasturtii]
MFICEYECYIGGFAAFAIILCSNTMRFYLKMSAFLIGSMLLATFLPIPMFIVRPRDYRNALLPAWGLRLLMKALGASYEVRGLENIQPNHGAVVVINHQSGIDLTVLAYLWPVIGRATVVAKREVLYAFPFGIAAYLWGTLFIDKSNTTDSVNRLNKETHAIREMDAKLLIFPEGTRHQGDELLPFKKGAFHIAIQSESAIQPVVVSKYRFLDSTRKVFGRGQSIIQILPEISCKGLRKDDITTLIENTHQLMQTTYEKLNAETYATHNKCE